MTHSIDLADPRTDRLMPYAEEPEAAIGGLAPSGPAAEQEAAVTLSVAKAEQAAMGMNFGTRALQRLQQARPGSDDWLGRDLAQTQREFDQLGPLAREVAWSVGPALKEGTLRNALRGFEARTQGASGTWLRFLDTAGAYVAAGGSPEAVRPALESGLGMMAKFGLLPPNDPAANQLLDDTLVAGRVRYLAARDPDAAEAYLAESAASPQATQLLTAEVAAVRLQRRQAEQAAFSKQLREQYRTMEGPGVPGPELPAEGFHRLYGEEEGERRHQVYRGQRARAAQRQAIRGQPPGEVARLRGEAADPQAFDAAVAEDAAARRADPAGYVQAYDPLLTGLPPQEAEAQAWAAQSRAGIPPGERRPWSLARVDALAKDWLALPPEQRAGWLQATLGGLPEEQRTAGIAQLAAAGLDQGSPGLLRATFEALRGHRRATAEAYARRISSEPPAMPDGWTGVQVADSGQIATDAVMLDPIWVTPDPLPEGRESAWGSGWRARGLPDVGAPGDWAASAYTEEGQQSLLHLIDFILSSEFSPEKLPEIEAAIDERFADDPITARYWKDQARTLLRQDPSLKSRIAGGAFAVTSAREEFEELHARVSRGEPYSEMWANAREDLAALEEQTGYQLRPVGEGMVGFFAGGDVPIVTVPVTSIEALAEDIEGTAADLAIVQKVIAGGLTPDELTAYAETLTRLAVVVEDELGMPHSTEDRLLADTVLLAAQALANHPEAAADIAADLFQVLQADHHAGRDFALDAAQMALDWVPGGDLISLGIDAGALITALRNGDHAGAVAAGLSAALNIIGLVPGVGDVIESGLRSLSSAIGIIKGPLQIAIDRLEHLAADGAQIVAAAGGAIKNAKDKYNRQKKLIPSESNQNKIEQTEYNIDTKNKKKLQLEENKANGLKYEEEFFNSHSLSDEILISQITIKSNESGTKVRLDFILKRAEKFFGKELKSSIFADLTKNQKKGFPEIRRSGGVVVGKGKPELPGGTEIDPMDIEIIRKGQVK